MLWAIGAILLQVHAVPQSAVPAAAAMATTEAVPSQRTAAAEKLLIADASVANEATPFEPGRLDLTPVAAPAAAPGPIALAPIAPVIVSGRKPAFSGKIRDGQRNAWIALSMVQHGAAAFDAWSTRRAITQNEAQELNPMLKPFANNPSIYAATQVTPLLLDILSRRMMNSHSQLLHRTWWLPQVLGTAASIAGGAHNLQIR
jgi:hypothetical protein